MSNLTFSEKQKFEQIFGMGSGYVLNFTNRTFEEFIQESTGHNIYDSRYDNQAVLEEIVGSLEKNMVVRYQDWRERATES